VEFIGQEEIFDTPTVFIELIPLKLSSHEELVEDISDYIYLATENIKTE
jgi:hypothetical protein